VVSESLIAALYAISRLPESQARDFDSVVTAMAGFIRPRIGGHRAANAVGSFKFKRASSIRKA